MTVEERIGVACLLLLLVWLAFELGAVLVMLTTPIG